MEISSNQSTLEILPDEILLEVCKYLLCIDILRSFFGLNSRITRMITQYTHHVSLHRISISHSSDLCKNILPHIGFKIRSLVIDHDYAALQNTLFIKYFGNKMSLTFPSLEKIRLVSFRYCHLIAFLNILHDLKNLVQINICNLLDMSENHQTIALKTLLEANNNQVTSILIDDQSSCLTFNDIGCYINILQLRIKLNSIKELPFLFAALPNVRYLHVTFEEPNHSEFFNEINIFPLLYLTDVRIHSTTHWWDLNQLLIILDKIPNLQRLSLFLSTKDSYLVYGNTLLPLLSPTIQQFNYAIYYYPELQFDRSDAIVASWPLSHSIRCYVSDTLWFIHTLNWYSKCIYIIPQIGKTFSLQKYHDTCYDKRVERLEVVNDRSFPLGKSLSIIARCHRMRELAIWISAEGDTVQEDKYCPSSLPQLTRLIQFQVSATIPVDLNYFSLILIAAPNLIRLNLPFDCLIGLFEIEKISHLLCQRIKSLAILNATESSQMTINEEHVHLIASNFSSLRDLYVDLKHLKASITTDSNEIKSSSMESMLLCLLSQLKQHKLHVLCVVIQPSENLRIDAKEWLKENIILDEQLFDAEFDEELNQLLIWM